MEINHTNYFVASAAKFQVIPKAWVKRLLRGGKNVRLGNRRYSLNFISKVNEWRGDLYGYRAKSFSAYWISTDGTELIRVSDHWCLGANKDWAASEKAKRCPNIGRCHWSLLGKPQIVETNVGGLTGGIVRFRDMREC